MKIKHGIIFSISVLLILFFIYKDLLTISENVYIVFKEEENFYKNKTRDIFYYKKQDRMFEFSSVKNKNVLQKKYSDKNNLKIITIDSLSKILPYSYYDTSSWGKKKLDRIKNLKIFFIELDSIKKEIRGKEVYQSFTEYDKSISKK